MKTEFTKVGQHTLQLDKLKDKVSIAPIWNNVNEKIGYTITTSKINSDTTLTIISQEKLYNKTLSEVKKIAITNQIQRPFKTKKMNGRNYDDWKLMAPEDEESVFEDEYDSFDEGQADDERHGFNEDED